MKKYIYGKNARYSREFFYELQGYIYLRPHPLKSGEKEEEKKEQPLNKVVVDVVINRK